jgi:hypothetical protein
MRLTHRFSLIGIGIIIFVIITPLLVFYARGFVFDVSNWHIVKTGALVVKTIPTKAEVYLDDKLQSALTPSSIRFLIPGDYNVRLEKTGYQSWTKRLNIRSQLVTWANTNREEIMLFFKQPQLQNSWATQKIWDDAPKIAEFLAGLDKIAPLVIESPPDLPEKNITVFTKDGDTLWYILGNKLKRFNYSTSKTEIINPDVPVFITGQIIRSDNQVYIILDGKLFVLNDTFEQIYGNVEHAYWDTKSRQMVLSNNNEIVIYNPGSKKTELILRSSSQVQNPLLNMETGYMFYQNEGKIKAIELDGQDHRNVYTIADAGENFTLDNDGRSLYIIGEKEIREYLIR